MNYKSLFGLFLAGLVLLPGCMHVSIYKKQLLQIIHDHCAYQDVQNNVVVQVQLLSPEDKNALFGDRSALIQDNGIQVIYLSIHNMSNVCYSFSPADIRLSMLSYRDIEKLMKTNSVSGFAKSVGFGAVSAGAIGWGVTGPMLCQSMVIAYVFLPLGIVAAGLTFAFLGKSIKSMIMNKRINKDIKAKTLHKKVVIKPGDSYEGLMFVKAVDYTPQFTVVMHEKDNEKNTVMFDVDLRQNASCV